MLKEITDKNNLFFQRWRKVVVPALKESTSEADLPADAKAKAADLDRQIAEKEKEIGALRAPRRTCSGSRLRRDLRL